MAQFHVTIPLQPLTYINTYCSTLTCNYMIAPLQPWAYISPADWPEICPGKSQQKSVIPLQNFFFLTSKHTHTHSLVFPAKRKCIGHHYFIPKRLCFHLDSESSLYFLSFLTNTHMQNHLLKAFHPLLSHHLLLSFYIHPDPQSFF